MTAETIIKLENEKSKEEKPQERKRHTTDVAGVFLAINITLVYACIWFSWSLVSREVRHNEISEYDAHGDSASKWFGSPIIKSMFTFLNEINPTSYFDPYNWSIRKITEPGFYIFIFLVLALIVQIWNILYETVYKCQNSVNYYMEYYIYMNAERTSVSVFMLFFVHFTWIGPRGRFFENLLGSLLLTESIILAVSVITICFLFEKRKSNIMIVHRFYNSRSFLIFFQELSVFAIEVVIIVASILMQSGWLLMYAFILLPLMHNYAKMVMILASASHDWNQNSRVAEFKILFSSMYTIARYHLGSAIIYTYFYWRPIRLNLKAFNDLTMFDSQKKEHIPPTSMSTQEYSMIFTAAYGQEFRKAKMSIEYFHKSHDGRLSNFKSKQLIAWKDLRKLLCYLIFTLNIRFVMNVKTEGELLPGIKLLLWYAFVQVLYNYVYVKSIDISEKTLRLRNEIKEEDLTTIDTEYLFKYCPNKTITVENDKK